ncbi:MAG: M28 family peptidase [Candidatus Hodarchaeota archaeon]
MKADDSYTEDAYNLIKDVIEKFGPRHTCSEAERKANLWIKERFSEICDETHFEEFETHPDLYPQGVFKFAGFFGAIAIAFMFFGFPFSIFPSALMITALIIVYLELFLMKRWIKPFFKKGISTNTFGLIKPKGEIKLRVVFEGHVDSAKQMKIAEKERVSLTPLLLGILYLVMTIVLSFVKFFTYYPGSVQVPLAVAGPIHWTVIDWIYYPACCVLFPCFYKLISGFIGATVVPGASDNLSGVAVAYAIGKYINKHKLENVEVIIGSMGSEEIGDRGARYFVAQHGDLLENAYAFIMDDIGSGNMFNIITKDFHVHHPYSPEVIERIEKAYEMYKKEVPDVYPMSKRKIPFGSSDACMYLNAGYKAGWIAGALRIEGKSDKLAKPPTWHSTRDNIDHIKPDALKHCIGIGLKFLEIVDKEAREL